MEPSISTILVAVVILIVFGGPVRRLLSHLAGLCLIALIAPFAAVYNLWDRRKRKP